MVMLSRVRDRARGALRRGDLEAASSLVALLRRRFPEDVDTLELWGEVELAYGHRSEARAILEASLAIDPERPVSRSGLALIAEAEGDLEEALRQFELAYAMNAGNRQLAGEICRLHSRLNHTIPVDPEPSLYAAACRHLREGDYHGAASLFQRGLRSDPASEEQAVGLARALWFAGRFSAAEKVAAGVVASQPNSLKPLAILAGASFSRGEAVAMAILRRTEQLNPGNDVARGIFVAASLPFPRIGAEPEIADELLIAAGASGAPTVTEAAARDRGAQAEQGSEGIEQGVPEEDGSQETGVHPLQETVVEGEWVRDRGGVPACWASPPLSGLWKRLRSDPASAPEVAGELLSMAESDLADPALLWLAADALALSGRFRRATQLYRMIAEVRAGEVGGTRETL